jgi:hypothetical protein
MYPPLSSNAAPSDTRRAWMDVHEMLSAAGSFPGDHGLWEGG